MSREKKKYIICTTARSGSNMVCDMLMQTGVLGKPIEGLNPDVIRASRGFVRALEDEGAISGADYLRWSLEDSNAAGAVYGLKILFEDFAKWKGIEAFREIFFESELIFLKRNSKARQAISYYFAEMTGQWVFSDPARMAVENVPFDYERIYAHFERLTKQDALWEAYLEGLQVSYQRWTFEDFVREPQTYIRQLICELGIEAQSLNLSLEPRLRAQSGPNSQAFLERFRQIFSEKLLQNKQEISYKGLKIRQ